MHAGHGRSVAALVLALAVIAAAAALLLWLLVDWFTLMAMVVSVLAHWKSEGIRWGRCDESWIC